jgi:hypothetical protein
MNYKKGPHDNVNEFPVHIEVLVEKGKTLDQDKFQNCLIVTLPDNNQVLRDVRFDYLDDEIIYNFLDEGVNGRPTASKILRGFNEKSNISSVKRVENVTYHHDRLITDIMLTEHDLWCCVCANDGWLHRQDDYAD